MDRFLITGGTPLNGTVTISGAKNAALPLMAAALLTEQRVTLHNYPHLRDIATMKRLLGYVGSEWSEGKTIWIETPCIERAEAPYDIVKTMRASSLVLGPMLARCGRARVSLPGGCAIGARPLDLHIKALQAMGAAIVIQDGYIMAQAGELRGTDFTFEKITVTGTENVMMAAVLAKGTTVLRNAAREPEIPDLAAMLNKMGAQVEGAGTDVITITGITSLHGCEHTIIPDRIEAGTIMIGAAMTGGHVTLKGVVPEHVEILIEKLCAAGAEIQSTATQITVKGPQRLKAVDCTTSPYPGYATDLQAQWMAAMSTAEGTSTIRETIYENRFMHVAELERMGAHIHVEGTTAIVQGKPRLTGAPVMATDLRASASLVLAGLMAQGETELQRVYHIDRGYEQIEVKLRGLGATIERLCS